MTAAEPASAEARGGTLGRAPRAGYRRALTSLCALGAALGVPSDLEFAAQVPPYRTPSAGLLAAESAASVALQVALSYTIIRVDLRFGPRVGLGWPPAPGWDDGDAPAARWRGLRGALLTGAGVGVVTAACVVSLAPLWRGVVRTRPPGPGAWWAAALGSVSAGILEEVWFRLGAMTLLAWAFARVGALLGRQRAATAPPASVMWAANATAALLFGAVHLPQAGLFYAQRGALVAAVLVGNGVVGLACGWLYWRRGLSAAMACHAAVDLVLHVLLPAAYRRA